MLFQSGILVSTALYILTVSKSSPFNPKVTSIEPEQSKDRTTFNIESALWKQASPSGLTLLQRNSVLWPLCIGIRLTLFAVP